MTQQMISVVIPVYNVAPYLRKCLESVLNQTHQNLEIILIDDGSNDGSEKICDEYAAKYSNVAVHHQENAGLSVARNRGLEESHGEWIAFLDSDDWVDPDMYQTLYDLAQEYDAEITSCGTKQVTVDGEVGAVSETGELQILNSDEMIAGLVTQEVVRFEVWNKLWKRSLIGDIRFIKGQVSEDVYFDRVLFLRANKMVHIDLPLHNYLVKRPGSTATSFKVGRLCIFDEFATLIQELEEQGKSALADKVRWIGTSFAYGTYMEAVDTKQEMRIREDLQNWHKTYYKDIRDKSVCSGKEGLKMKLFSCCPGPLIALRKLRNRLR